MYAAIQGELGSFSHQAAIALLPNARVVPCIVSRNVFDALTSGKVQCAVIPIENSLAGPVTEHYDLLLEYPFYIERESRLRIVHNLIARPATSLKDVKRVLSHPVALAQCREFFRLHPRLHAEPFYDTAGAVKHVMAEGLRDTAAIASKIAAREYEAKILTAGIEDNRENYTRFLLVKKLKSKRSPVPALPRSNKTSLAFALKNEPGTLFAALRAFAEQGINMAKIESRPVVGRPWEYVFYVDLNCGRTASAARAQKDLARCADFVKVLGVYPSA